MYCSTCGKEQVQGLVFCSGCGARVAGEEPQAPVSEASQNFLLAGILGLPIVGIGLIIGLVTVLKQELGFKDDMVFVVTFMCFLLLLVSEAAFIFSLLFRMRAAKRKAKTPVAPQYPAQMKDVDLKGLPESRIDPVSSVTDHTTRQLEYEAREKKGSQ